MPRSFAAALLCLPTWLFLLSPAVAQEDPESLIRQGNDMRRDGDPERAYGYFKRAYDISHTPRTAAQLGLVEQSLNNFSESDRHLSEALRTTDPWVEKNRAALEECRSKARVHLGRIEVRGAPAGAESSLGGSTAVPLPKDGLLYAVPGQIEVRISANGRETRSTVSVSIDETVVLDVAAALPVEPGVATGPASRLGGRSGGAAKGSPSGSTQLIGAPAADAKPGASAREISGIATGAAGLALGVAGLFVYRSGANKLDDINKSAAAGKAYNASDANWQTLADLGIGMMVGGAAALVAGGLLYWWGHNPGNSNVDTSGTNVNVAPVSGRGFALQLSGRF